MKEKIILCLGGGAMKGVFGAGVMTGLQRMNLYDKIEAIYGISAGTINAAYFLSKQAKKGSSIYYEDLTNNFIKSKNIPYGSAQRYWNNYIKKIPRKKIIDAVDINYLFDIIKNKKVLNIEKIKKTKIKFYVMVLDVDNGKIKCLDVKKHNILKTLKAGVSAVPYYFDAQNIDKKRYADASIKDPLGIKFLLKKYPDHKIVLQTNVPIKRRKIRNFLHNLPEGLVAKPMYPAPLLKYFLGKEKKIREGLDLAKKNKNILLIYPPKNNPSTVWTTDPKKLKRTYEMGIKKAEKIRNFIRN